MVYVHVVEDGEPELDELFQVELSNPTGGARIGSRGAIDVVIATNDNAHGIIGFAEVSVLAKPLTEQPLFYDINKTALVL